MAAFPKAAHASHECFIHEYVLKPGVEALAQVVDDMAAIVELRLHLPVELTQVECDVGEL